MARLSGVRTWVLCVEHFGTTSRRCLDMRSNNWFTIKLGGKAETPPRGITMTSLQMGHRNEPFSRAVDAWLAMILSKQSLHTVCEHWSNLGVCSAPSYGPKIHYTHFYKHIKPLLFKNKHTKPLEKKSAHKKLWGQILQCKHRKKHRF